MPINLEILACARIDDPEKCTSLEEKTIVSDMMLRRRLTRNARISLYLTHAVQGWNLPVVIGNAYGEVAETYDILRALATRQTLSPTAFQNSVHNTPASYLSIVGNNRGYVTTVSDLHATSRSVLQVGALKSLEFGTMLLIVTDAMGFEHFDQLNRCGIDKKESGAALIVRRTDKAPTFSLDSKRYPGYSPSLWPMLELCERFDDPSIPEKIVAVEI